MSTSITSERIREYLDYKCLTYYSKEEYPGLAYEFVNGQVRADIYDHEGHFGRPDDTVHFCLVDFTVWLVERNKEN